ncbi:unnamed protein product [Clonostachys byssicola]|uniref:Ribosomal protein S21 n=1 Tax=Clonostachys byssicola TaxID=160290 RepID=A0A9N9UK86_9HYPO|nr:unnamed protein product [Clonostachys byssicola]
MWKHSRWLFVASTSRYGSMLLSRAAARPPFTSPLAIRSFTTSRFALDDSAPVRRSPLIGNYTAPKRSTLKPDQTPPVSTEHPQASQPPNPSRAPTSSAEVPPNADLPPPPPPAGGASPAAQDASTSSSSHAYDVNAPLDLKLLLNNAYNTYALQTGVANRSGTPTENVYAKPVTGKTVFLEGRYGGAQKAGNPAGAFRVLDRLVKEQKVKRLFNQQRFHERKGMKRKRLRMERWRFRFKDGFKAAASRVLELKKQGW